MAVKKTAPVKTEASATPETIAANKSIKKTLKMLSNALDIKTPKGATPAIRRKKMVKKIKKRLERAKGQPAAVKAAE